MQESGASEEGGGEGGFVVAFVDTDIGNWSLKGSFSKPPLATNLERIGSH